MKEVINYINNTLVYMVVSFPIIVFIRALMYLSKKVKDNDVNWSHESGVIFFSMYIIGLISQTFFSNFQVRAENVIVNIIPFNKIREIWDIVIVEGRVNYFFIEILGNVGVFVVVGFTLPLLWRKFERSKTDLLVCFSFSLFIEIVQLLLPRCSDIDDLIMNTLGGVIGYYMYNIIKRMSKGITDVFKIQL